MDERRPFVIAKCVGCGHEEEIATGDVPAGSHPMCPKCYMPMVAKGGAGPMKGMYGDGTGEVACLDPERADGKHCGHFTGRGWDTGMATHGGVELECCFCGGKVEAPYTVERRPFAGHGLHLTRRVRIYDTPEHWTMEPSDD